MSATVPRLRLWSSLYVVEHSSYDSEVNAECATNAVVQFFACCVRLVCFFVNVELVFLRPCLFRRHVSNFGFKLLFRRLKFEHTSPVVHVGIRTGVWVSRCMGDWVFFFFVDTCLSLTVSTTRGTVPLPLVTARHDRIPSQPYGHFSVWKAPHVGGSQKMAGAQQARSRVDLCAAKSVHAPPKTHSINATARCDFTTDELMAMCAVRSGAPSRVQRGSPDESEESCL